MVTDPNNRRIDSIAARLVATREARGMSQAEFAAGAEIARNTYNQWEMAKGRPSLDEAIKLCDTYNLTLDWIFLGDPGGLNYTIASKIFERAS